MYSYLSSSFREIHLHVSVQTTTTAVSSAVCSAFLSSSTIKVMPGMFGFSVPARTQVLLILRGQGVEGGGVQYYKVHFVHSIISVLANIRVELK